MFFSKKKTNVRSKKGIHIRKEDGWFKVRDDLGFEAHFKTIEEAFERADYFSKEK